MAGKGRGAKFKAGPSKIAGQKKAPAGEDRRALLTGEGAQERPQPCRCNRTLDGYRAFNCGLLTVTELITKL
jgi:hypothetical protein